MAGKARMKRGQQTRGAATGRTASVPAPVGGLNAVDSLAAMPPEDAVILDNFFPQPTYVQLRNGCLTYTQNLPGWVETLAPYNNKSGTEKIFGWSGTAVYDCSASGLVGAPVVTGLTNAQWESVNVPTPSGAYLYAANGVDKPLNYDGTTWVSVDAVSTPAITGVTTTNLFCPQLWGSRLWFVEKNTTKAWYLPVQSVGGAATSFELAGQFSLGGYLAAIMTFSLSSTNSFDDYIGFLSSEGQLIVYQGTDPGSATTFARVGSYNSGKPIGRRCWFKYGADAIILSSEGLVSVSRLIAIGVQQTKDTVSYKIQQLINADIRNYSTIYGWQGVVHPFGNKIIINVPVANNSKYHQYVMNTLTGAWCSYGLVNASAWNAACFCVSGDRLFFGFSTVTCQADIGTLDYALNFIFGTAEPAFSYFGTNREKRFTMARPVLLTDGLVYPALGLNLDFSTNVPTGTPTFAAPSGSAWDSALWDAGIWSTNAVVQKNWQTVYGVGFAAAIYIQIAAQNVNVQWLSTDFVLEDGGVL